MNDTPVIWALIDERPGTGNQCSAVAKALNLPFEEKQLVWSALANLPNFLTGVSLRGLTEASRSEFKSPWPDLVIASGRRAGIVARYIKKQSLDDCRLVHIMYPGDRAISEFDLVAVPNHDGAVKDDGNIMRIIGAPHGIGEVELSRGRLRWHAKFAGLEKPLFGLIVGGATKRRPFTKSMAEELGRQTGDLVARSGGSLIITTSPRTGDALAGVLAGLAEKNVEPAFVYQWAAGNASEDNPYLGFLAHADQLIVTGESTSMCSEVCALGKPVYIFAPSGFLGDKHSYFVAELTSGGYAHLLGEDEKSASSAAPHTLDVAAEIAAEIQQRILID